MDEIPVSAAEVPLGSLATKVWIAIKDPWISSVALVFRCISSRLSSKNCGVRVKIKCNSVRIGLYVKVWNNFWWVRNNLARAVRHSIKKPANCGWIVDGFWTNFYNLLRLRDCHSCNVSFTGFSARAKFRVSWPIIILVTLENVSHLFVFYFFYFEFFYISNAEEIN